MGGFVRDITGVKAQRQAARDAANIQQEATDRSLELLERTTAPYRELGESSIAPFQNFVNDPSGASFLQSNPLFQAAVDDVGRQTKAFSAAGGKLNSGGTIDQLFKNYLSIGDQFVNSAFNRAYTPVQLGANTATFNATQGSNLLTNNANAQGAALIQRGGAQAGMFNNLLQAGTTAAAAAFSDERLKTDIEYLGVDHEGHNVYEYSYKDPSRFVGYMAQEVEEKDPGNVLLDPSGYLKVTERYRPVQVA